MKHHPNLSLFFPLLTLLSSLSGSRDGQETAWVSDSFPEVSTTSLGNIFGREAQSTKHIFKPG